MHAYMLREHALWAREPPTHSTAVHVPLCTSHSRSVLSSEPLTTVRLSCRSATQRTAFLWPCLQAGGRRGEGKAHEEGAKHAQVAAL